MRVPELRFCPEGGWVVAENPVPTDPSDVWSSEAGDVFGCNRLVCGGCGGAVRQAPNLSHSRGIKKHLGTLAETEDWSTLPFLEPGYGSRLYACSCRTHVAHTRQLCDDDDFDSMTDVALPWRCAGHPVPALPLELEGLTVDASTDLEALVARVMDGWTPEGATALWRGIPATWLGRLYTRLSGLPQAEVVARAVAQHLGDAEEEHVGAALFFFRWFPDAPDGESVLDLADAAGASTPFHYPSWSEGAHEIPAHALAARLVQTPHAERRAVLHLRGAVQEAEVEVEPTLIRALAVHDGEWLARSAASVARDAEGALKILYALRDTEQDELVVVAGVALAEDPLLREALLSFLDNAFHRDRPFVPVLLQALG